VWLGEVGVANLQFSSQLLSPSANYEDAAVVVDRNLVSLS